MTATPIEEALARHMAEDRGFDPDALGTEWQMFSRDGISVLPEKTYVLPIWMFYVNEARKTLARVADLQKSENANG